MKTSVPRPPSRPEDFTAQRECAKCGNLFTITGARSTLCTPCRTVDCRVCGSAFVQSPGDGRATCSPECSKRLNNAPMLTCQRCGIAFPQRRGHAMKYCSRECRCLAARVDETELATAKRRTWRYRQWRRAVFDRDDSRCQQCGSREYLHAHHLKPWRDHLELRYDVANGQTLCAICHEVVHGMKLPRRQKKFPNVCTDCGKTTKGTSLRCRGCGVRHSALLRKSRTQAESL